MKYPVFTPEINKKDLQYVNDALKQGEISGNFGKYIEKFENKFAAYCGTKYAVTVSNGTCALNLALSSIGIKKGDEVLVSSSTNIASALAVVYLGAKPIPIDSEIDTWNIDPRKIEKFINKKTKAIIPVHLYGNPANMLEIKKISRKYGLVIIEDAAEAHGAEINKQKTGSFGHLGCFSFYANKIITTGEGGMVTTNSKKLYNKLKYLKNLAFGKPRFVHKEIGFNYRLTGYQAAMGLSQLENIEKNILNKIRISKLYKKYLDDRLFNHQLIKKDYKSVYWMYGITLKRKNYKNILQKKLLKLGIDTRNFFFPISQQPCFKYLNLNMYKTPISNELWENGLYLPSSTSLTESDIIYISNKLNLLMK